MLVLQFMQYLAQAGDGSYGSGTYGDGVYQPTGELSETGDPALIALWVGVTLVGIALLVFFLRKRRK